MKFVSKCFNYLKHFVSRRRTLCFTLMNILFRGDEHFVSELETFCFPVALCRNVYLGDARRVLKCGVRSPHPTLSITGILHQSKLLWYNEISADWCRMADVFVFWTYRKNSLRSESGNVIFLFPKIIACGLSVNTYICLWFTLIKTDMDNTFRIYPIGIQNFEQLRNNNNVYVDKTELKM